MNDPLEIIMYLNNWDYLMIWIIKPIVQKVWVSEAGGANDQYAQAEILQDIGDTYAPTNKIDLGAPLWTWPGRYQILNYSFTRLRFS